MQIKVFAEIWMVYWPVIQIDNPTSVVSVITRCRIVYQSNRFLGLVIVAEDISVIWMTRDVFYGMPDELGDMIINGIFPCRIGHFARKRDVLSDITLNINPSAHIGIVIIPCLILLVNPLSQCPFQKSGKQIDQKIENALHQLGSELLSIRL